MAETIKVLEKYESPTVVTYGKRALEFEPSTSFSVVCSSSVVCENTVGTCAVTVTIE